MNIFIFNPCPWRVLSKKVRLKDPVPNYKSPQNTSCGAPSRSMCVTKDILIYLEKNTTRVIGNVQSAADSLSQLYFRETVTACIVRLQRKSRVQRGVKREMETLRVRSNTSWCWMYQDQLIKRLKGRLTLSDCLAWMNKEPVMMGRRRRGHKASVQYLGWPCVPPTTTTATPTTTTPNYYYSNSNSNKDNNNKVIEEQQYWINIKCTLLSKIVIVGYL